MAVYVAMCTYVSIYYERRIRSPKLVMRIYQQLGYLYDLVYENDAKYVAQLRIDRETFRRLCKLLCERGGLVSTKNVSTEEMLAMFLHILAHHVKNRVISFNFKRSGRTISKCFHECLKAMTRCQKEFWKRPEPVLENSIDPRWKWFKVCSLFFF